eukprot:CAMPEP_0172306098 /NCGR_PEP_ID=MMETSP1058-20130122/7237_1 /TAXON_ID=83371 /ORGANISM="Detonula confervacea, Strain CCMP 353" /LENGTH=288 /DNA_ID=CAMNT_0013017879 /DNA_START=24 /DNA_END=890 /DNA_ORIENTATION=+
MADNTATAAAAQSQAQDGVPNLSQHTPSLAGSVLECPDGFGGTLLIRLQNMSATADLGVRLDLKQIALRCRNTEFNPRRFAAVIMRLREPRATALVFASGKLVITGTKSSHNSSLATKKIAYILERVGFQPASYINFKVQNIVGTVDVGFPIRLEGVAFAHPTFSSYEPELFPGLIYRLVQPRVVLLIFVSGKVVITGAKTEEQMVEGLKKVHPVLLEFRKVNVASAPGTAAAAARDGVPCLPPMGATASLVASGKAKGKKGGKGKELPRARRGKDLQNAAQKPTYEV